MKIWVIIDWNDDGATPITALWSEAEAREFLEEEGQGYGWALGSCTLHADVIGALNERRGGSEAVG